MIIMGIDQSLTGSGITVFDGEHQYYYLISTSKTKNTKAPTIDYTRRLIEMTNEIEDLIIKHSPKYIAMEGMSFGARGAAIFDLGGLSHLLRAMFVRQGVEFVIIPPKTIKKYFTGSGNANKLEMIEEAMRRGADIPFFKTIQKQKVFDDNVSDSYAIACFIQDYLDGKCADYENKIEKSWEV